MDHRSSKRECKREEKRSATGAEDKLPVCMTFVFLYHIRLEWNQFLSSAFLLLLKFTSSYVPLDVAYMGFLLILVSKVVPEVKNQCSSTAPGVRICTNFNEDSRAPVIEPNTTDYV
ncbi:hypothetical protein E3N88_28986 [Mikania micrantha]|uniref:Uncharacterized protein n=1 Tax=Mikania micrantha TaxID=192012 RepID=A0A5N6N3V4_9ASTR|nr:hypothetical protein E3N88_28986 [Mikania micrantha]